ncbi:hypothetical protein AAG906_020677 [Vitis piasezkii]
MKLELKVELRICCYRWSIDLVIPSCNGHLYESRFLIIHPNFGLPHQDHVLTCCTISHSWRRVGGRLIIADSHKSSDSLVEMSDELVSTLASIQEFMTAQTLPPGASLGIPFHLADHYETIPPPTITVPPPIVTTTDDTRLAEQEARVERLESRMRHIRLQDGGLTWDDRDGIWAASLVAKFRMPNIERYSGIGCPKIHLRLYNTVMRAHGIDDAQLVAFFPMSLIDPSRLRTWEGVAHEFLTQFAFSANIDPRFARRLVGIPFQDLKSLVHATFNVKETIARGLWIDTTISPDSKGKKLVGSSSRSGEVDTTNYQHQRPAHHSPYMLPTVRAHFSHP